MDSLYDRIDPDRLCDAADAVLRAVHEVAARGPGYSPPPSSLMGTSAQPSCLDGFDAQEVEAATAMLMRLGMLRGSRAA